MRLSYNEVSISHPDAPKAILRAPLRKTSFYKLFAIPNSNYIGLMSELDPKKEGAIRMNISSAYTLTNCLKNELYMDSLIELLEKRILQVSRGGKPLNFGDWIHYLTWDIMGEITFSKRFGFLDQARDVGNVLSNTFYLAFYVTSMAYMQWLHALLFGNPILRWLDFQPNEHAYMTCVNNIAERKQHKEPHVDMMEYWLGSQARDPEHMTDKDVFCAVMGNLGGGGDTIGSVLQAFFYHMLKAHPRHLHNLRQEIDTAAAAGKLSRIVSYTEAQKLPYLQACIKETLRIFPAVAWNLPREVPAGGLTIGDRHFSPGTIVSVNPYVHHRNTACFGPDAETFNPERWLISTTVTKELERHLIAFGMGYNVCPGQNVAKIELSKVTATILRDFDLQLENPKKDWEYHRTFIAPQRGWDCFLTRRKGAAFPEDADRELGGANDVVLDMPPTPDVEARA